MPSMRCAGARAAKSSRSAPSIPTSPRATNGRRRSSSTRRLDGGALGHVTSSTDFMLPYNFHRRADGRSRRRFARISSRTLDGTLDIAALRAANPFPDVTLVPAVDGLGRPAVRIDCPMPGSADVSHHPFQAEMDELIACVLEGRDTSLDVFDAQKTMEVCLAADRSAELGGAPVALPLIDHLRADDHYPQKDCVVTGAGHAASARRWPLGAGRREGYAVVAARAAARRRARAEPTARGARPTRGHGAGPDRRHRSGVGARALRPDDRRRSAGSISCSTTPASARLACRSTS